MSAYTKTVSLPKATLLLLFLPKKKDLKKKATPSKFDVLTHDREKQNKQTPQKNVVVVPFPRDWDVSKNRGIPKWMGYNL